MLIGGVLVAFVAAALLGPGRPVRLPFAERAPSAAEVVHLERDAREVEYDSERPLERAIDLVGEDALEEARREREDLATAVSRDVDGYKKRVGKELGDLDNHVAELDVDLARAKGTAKEETQQKLAATREWRAKLKRDLEDLSRTSEDDWPALKSRIDRDLEDERPSTVPVQDDKSYAI